MKKIVFTLLMVISFFIGINVSAVHNGWNLITCPGSSQKCWSYYSNNVEKKRLSKMVIIHSGWPEKPDNSIGTLQGLKAGGYYALSADVHFTKDNIPVLSHDPTINRMAGTVANPSQDLNGASPIYISSLTLSEINAKYVFPRDRNRKYLSAYANNKITKFEDAVKYCHDNGLTMEVELKTGNVQQVKIALDIIKKYNMNGSVLWTSFHGDVFLAINDNTTGQLMQFFGPQMTDQQARDFYNKYKSRLANRNTYIVSSTDGAYVVPLEMNEISQYPQSKYVINITPTSEPPKVVEVTGITLSVTNAKMSVGKSLNLKSRMTINPSNATNQNVTWTSSNPSVATVDSNGLVTTKAVGIATITVKSNNGKTATCKVTVTNSPIEVTGVSLKITSITMNVEKTLNLKSRLTITPSNATNQTVTWTSSNPSVATVDSNGLVTTKAVGTAIITVKSNNGKTATCKITVTGGKVEVTGISLKITSITMNVGKTLNLKSRLTITPSNATNQNVTWTSSNPSVATVDSNRLVTTKSVGTSIITVKSNNGKTTTCKVTVTKDSNISNPKLIINPKNIYLPIDDGTEFSQIKVNVRTTINGSIVSAKYDWSELKNKLNIIGDIKHESNNSESVVISSSDGGSNDKCKKATYYVESKYSSITIANSINVCTYGSKWQRKAGVFQFDVPQKNRKEMLTVEGCYAYEDLDNSQSNANSNVYIYKTSYDRCGHNINETKESPVKIVIILVLTFFIIFGLQLLIQKNRRKVKRINY